MMKPGGFMAKIHISIVVGDDEDSQEKVKRRRNCLCKQGWENWKSLILCGKYIIDSVDLF